RTEDRGLRTDRSLPRADVQRRALLRGVGERERAERAGHARRRLRIGRAAEADLRLEADDLHGDDLVARGQRARAARVVERDVRLGHDDLSVGLLLAGEETVLTRGEAGGRLAVAASGRVDTAVRRRPAAVSAVLIPARHVATVRVGRVGR